MEITFSSEIKGNDFIRTAHFADENYYFKIPAKYKDDITELADPFVILLIFRMMRYGGDFHLKGTVSKSLLDNLELFSSYWHAMLPEYYKKITITADEEFNDIPVALSDKAVAAFSGGLDASAMLYRHNKNLAGRNSRNIERCILIKGVDIPLSADEKFRKTFFDCEKMCNDLNADLVEVEINYRSYPHYWNMEHMACIAAVLRLWKEYPYQMIASTYPVNGFKLPFGTNPVTDHLFSSNRYLLIEGDVDLSRTEKAALIKNWKTGLENLRVCWQGPMELSNCGVCEKCTHTYLNFRASGIKELSCMTEKFNFKNLLQMDDEQFEIKEKYMTEILGYVIKHGVKDNIFEKLETEIQKRRKKRKWKKLTYYRSMLLSKITFGERKRHYAKKCAKLSGAADKMEFVTF